MMDGFVKLCKGILFLSIAATFILGIIITALSKRKPTE